MRDNGPQIPPKRTNLRYIVKKKKEMIQREKRLLLLGLKDYVYGLLQYHTGGQDTIAESRLHPTCNRNAQHGRNQAQRGDRREEALGREGVMGTKGVMRRERAMKQEGIMGKGGWRRWKEDLGQIPPFLQIQEFYSLQLANLVLVLLLDFFSKHG